MNRGRGNGPSGPGQVRIIGGRWRNTRLEVPQVQGLRPTSDRVRETLFNWLMPKLPGARVLDLFAGSGALGLEAVSRGAASAQLVERDPALATALRAVVGKLGAAEQVQVAQADALQWLDSAVPAQADLVFLDPPFAAGLWEQVIARLPRHLAEGAWLYVEAPAGAAPILPAGWSLHREGGTRDVGYALYRQAAATLRGDMNATEPA
ncbi:16S rRNA (guanine(966)-N(2))-methyltransferase RsmD [Stenotrophomonas sp. SY1]|uniref:16S rRNA (guanine(966)-N(2))-methyltransferase RsmD n=1 Tax=Stenotrophomonas sp. SY1 TaxID=477235 RepID=UPI001E35DD7C|nr:16S rRNA (guanine(966)-N(2))-methyltransferase RsmD [Stenotrophomonas sp. SY1]MCD9086813.1 16S rRNA (guanine(966)-N(2))-methyltransferase RsmD [Stenotrophomonas sp. SY1]